ncbi:MAG: hybrid sensor histidine kinase/response regulator [Planctomycetota bacterium]
MSASNHPETIATDDVLRMLREGQSIQPELKDIFSEEAEDHLRTIYDGLDRLQVDGGDQSALGDVRRASHTLKGAAGAVGVDAVTRLAHRMEDLLDHLAEGGKSVTSGMALLMLSTADRLQELTGEAFDADKMAESVVKLYTQYGDLLAEATAQNRDVVQPVNATIEPEGDDTELAAALAAFGAEMGDVDLASIDPAEAELSKHDLKEIEAELETATTQNTEADRAEATSAAIDKSVANEANMRVPLGRLDDLTRLVGEMIINRSAFASRLQDFTCQIDDLQTALGRLRGVTHDVETQYSVEALRQGEASPTTFTNNRLAGIPGFAPSSAPAIDADRVQEFDELEFDRYTEFHLLARTLSEATGDVASIAGECRALSGDFDALLQRWQRLTRDAQDRLMQIRMVPMRTIVPRLGRAVRSAAASCGKQVRLVVRGDHTELDKTVLEEIADPMLHLVRNAVDHGIECEQQRLEAGKPAEATLLIEAVNQGTQMTLRVEDDGQGLDARKIRSRAIERGLIGEDDQLSNDELYMLVFSPGFSTKENVTDLSGRGVGMDVVRETVQRLKGTIRIDSAPGQGAKFTIILPTTLAVTRALVISAGGSQFALPMQAVNQISRLDPAKVRRIGEDAVLDLDGRTLRMTGLSHRLLLAPAPDLTRPVPMLIIESGDRRVAVLVDAIEGGQDIVVKSLGDHLRQVPGLIGATVRGDGSVIPILDPADLVGLVRSMPNMPVQRSGSSQHDRRRNVLIVDDSVSVRRITASVMRTGGWAVMTAKDGVDALETLAGEEAQPNVILLDMEMPRMDGLELLANLRSSQAYRDTPVIMVTSRAGEKHRNRAMAAGATDYVVKPFRDDDLLALAARLADQEATLV